MTTTRRLIALAFVSFAPACDEEEASEMLEVDEDRSADYCPTRAVPEQTQALSSDDIERIGNLPYFASAVVDFPTGDRLMGATLLSVEADGRRVLRVNSTDLNLTHTMFVELDVTDALSIDKGDLKAELWLADERFGSVSINGIEGQYLQGTLDAVKFHADASGLFALTFVPKALDVWPPDDKGKNSASTLIGDLEQEFRVIGRLRGTCMAELPNGIVGRVMDLSSVPDCDKLLSHL